MLVVRPREDVDHARVGVGPDLDDELAEPVHDLGAAVHEAQFPRELGRPLGKPLDVGEVGKNLPRR